MSEATKNEELIADLVRAAWALEEDAFEGSIAAEAARLMNVAVDALRAATAPVQGDRCNCAYPEGHASYCPLHTVLPVQGERDKDLSTSPERVNNSHDSLHVPGEMFADKIERVRAIHQPSGGIKVPRVFGGEPEDTCKACTSIWPCSTITALEGAPEPEWEYGLLNPQAPDGGKPQGGAHLISDSREHIVAQQRRGHPAIQAVRRRKAGPWLPVEGEKP